MSRCLYAKIRHYRSRQRKSSTKGKYRKGDHKKKKEKAKLSLYSIWGNPGELLIEKNIVPAWCQSPIALGLEHPFRMPKISLKQPIYIEMWWKSRIPSHNRKFLERFEIEFQIFPLSKFNPISFFMVLYCRRRIF